MADAKVIPFDDDRSRSGGSPRAARRRSPGRGNGSVSALPGQSDAGLPPEEPEEPEEAVVAPEEAERGGWDRRIAGGLAFLRRRVTGEYDVDEFGYDEELTDQVLMSVLRPMYEKYFRVEVKGIENIPSDGGALIVSNHSGTLPLDGLMLQVAVHDNHPAGRHLRLLAADLVF
ncbi:1-acyl-sn-glycerol-3-phosphate acyltransferase, partial [Streptomyces sp. NPDC048669]|uniref:1-acyl-sn-glycerol-3-phosphate acyltransferase n=1 Tax=Streptomyces sp. NPDC048669 TaxID=3155267 RepID=UPI003415FBA9